MKPRPALTELALALGLAACAGGDGTLGTDQIRATGLEGADDPKVDVRYPALLTYEAKGEVRIIESCFTWCDAGSGYVLSGSGPWFGYGPYCFPPEGEAGPDKVRSMVVTGYPGTYNLEGYIRYVAGGVVRSSNRISREINVTKRH